MGFEDFPKMEPKKEDFEKEPEEKVLNPEEIEQLGGEMNDYLEGLKLRIEELRAELEELETEYSGLKEMADDIESGDFEEITEKPYEG